MSVPPPTLSTDYMARPRRTRVLTSVPASSFFRLKGNRDGLMGTVYIKSRMILSALSLALAVIDFKKLFSSHFLPHEALSSP